MLDKVVEFFIKYGEGLFTEEQRDELRDIIALHIVYGTIKVWVDDIGIVACARWNWLNDKQVEILDFVIRPDHRKKGMVNDFAKKCLEEFPQCVGMFFQDKKLKNRFYKRREYFFKRSESNERTIKA